MLLVIDPRQDHFGTEIEILEAAREQDKQVLILFNLFDENDRNRIETIISKIGLLQFYSPLAIRADDIRERQTLLNFILKGYESKRISMELLPFIEKDENYILVIPMDVETPEGRFLRPQQMAVEYITRNFAYPSCFRPDLGKARDPGVEGEEKQRFLSYLEGFRKRPRAIITDSQAMDILSKWCPDDIL